uniref:Protocadherin-11 X-linked n=1 Tax=Phallusia mammillata TaxID=59560 RepID=A0A6F9DNS6_9ASCI|nr:protocadherin-11 X-linked [Phallusia mammillata]
MCRYFSLQEVFSFIYSMELIYLVLACLCALDYCQAQDHIYRTNEETGKGHYVGNVPQDIGLAPLPPNGQKRSYRIMNGGDKISVDAVSGDLKTAMQLDREVLCPDNPDQCEINVEVLVVPPFRLLNLLFIVNDLNDNAPKFPTEIIKKDISESAIVGSAIRLDSAIDPDLKLNSIQNYKISSSPPSRKDKNGVSVPYFRLDIIQNIDGTKIPQLNLTQSLDREQVDSYELLLYAIDGGSTALTGTATVQISVTDSNDNQPEFPQDSYVREIPESMQPGSLVIQVTASDLDAGSNADIEYTFPTVVNDHDRSLFDLDSETGAITIKEPGLDFENKNIHHLTVEARDRGPNPASAYTTVTVKVLDVNDEAPHIDVSFMDFVEKKIDDTGSVAPNSVLIKEDIANETYIAFVTVTDRDTGKNGRVVCHIKQPSSFELKDLDQDQNRYLIRTKNLLDRETERYHKIEIVATDEGSPSLSNTTTVLVELLDINDNAPKFGKPEYIVDVSENVDHGERVTEILAQDPDAGANAQITYSIRPTYENTVTPFTIDADTGIVRFANDATKLDAENATEPFALTVTATDNGDPRLSSTTLLTIKVMDENDNVPVFRKKIYDFRIREDSKRGTYVGQVIADDADVDKTTNARITYSFAHDSNEPNPFTLKEETGEIHFDGEQSQIDREARDSRPYILTVEAWDNGKDPTSDRATVEIYLEDVNDNSPSIVFPNVTRDIAIVYIVPQQEMDETLSEAVDGTDAPSDEEAMDYLLESSELSVAQQVIRIGTSESPMQSHPPLQVPVLVTQIRAVDRDASENGHVRYSLVDGNVNDYFSVDMSSGNITLNLKNEDALRAMKRGCHVIKISVSDLGKPVPMTTPAWVNIYITDSTPGTVNISDAMKDCQNNSFFPVIFAPDDDEIGAASSSNLLFILIVTFVAVFAIILIITIALLIKYKCRCAKDKKSRTYNCQQAADVYSEHSYAQGSPIVKKGRGKGSPFGDRTARLHLPNGTADSRSSNFSEWTASQMQISQVSSDWDFPQKPQPVPLHPAFAFPRHRSMVTYTDSNIHPPYVASTPHIPRHYSHSYFYDEVPCLATVV